MTRWRKFGRFLLDLLSIKLVVALMMPLSFLLGFGVVAAMEWWQAGGAADAAVGSVAAAARLVSDAVEFFTVLGTGELPR